MIDRVLLLLAAGLAAVSCGGRSGVGAADGAAPAGARVVALSDSLLAAGGCDTVRLGRMRPGEVVVKRLWIENRTEHPVVPASYTRSCGCTTLDYSAEPIAPGCARELTLTFDSRGERGWQLKLVELRFAGAARNLRLLVEADVD